MSFRSLPVVTSLGVLAVAIRVAAQTVSTLPLQPGFYVAAKTACGAASNATLVLVTKDGMNRSQIIDRYNKIEKTGPTSYRVAGTRTFMRNDRTEPLTGAFDVLSPTSFRGHYPDGSADFRFCAQNTLPAPWRNNNIRDLVQ